MHQDALAGVGILQAMLLRLRIAPVLVAIHEVVDHFDRVMDFEFADSAVTQVVRNGGDTVAMLDREPRDRQIRAVQTDQRDVGAMQRGDKRDSPAMVPVGEHLLRQQSAHRMRDGVVHMQQVERVNVGHLRHPRGQRQIIGRIVEQRIL